VRALETAAAEKMTAYQKALDDGDTKKAAELLNEVRRLDRQVAAIESSEAAARSQAIAVEQVRLDMLIDSLEEKYPQLRQDADEYDEDLVDEIQDLRTAFEATGMASSAALRKAVKYALRDADTGVSAKEIDKDVDAAAKDADKEADKAEKAEQRGRERKAEAVKRNLKMAGKQPADTGKAPGLDSQKLGGGVDGKSVPAMSEEDFDALPESKKAQLRGDYFAPTM
jgi:hypothetical protein